ncbi:MAG TPA: aspartate/glutamate racemase family protein [Vicinamibacterales bacterium]|nr:aspartate/glutamate racemase family protein [Vicinamibacterales bacterium]
MRIRVINPNASEAVTSRIALAASAAARTGTEIEVIRCSSGPSAIQSHYEMVLAGPGLLDAVRDGEQRGCDGYVLASFGDPGLDAAREITRAPVVGIGEAAMHAASYLAGGFIIVTTLPRMRIFAERLAADCGMERHCRSVTVVDCDIRTLAADPAGMLERMALACSEALDTHGADAVVLGSAGMAGLGRDLSQRIGVPVVDGVAVAVKWVEGLADLALATSRRGPFAAPESLR